MKQDAGAVPKTQLGTTAFAAPSDWAILQTSVLHRLEGAAGDAEEHAAGDAFRGWAEAEHLIVKFGE